jgi:hypothetical protein
MPHLGVATLTGVAPDSVWQGDYLLKGLEHLRAYGTVAPAAAGLTVGTALKLIDSATRTDYGVGIGQCIGLLLHCIPSCSTCPWLSNQIQFESFHFVRSDHPVSSPCARWATMCSKANWRRVLIHLPHGYVSYATWSIFWISLYASRIYRLVGDSLRSRTLRCKLPCSACCNPGTEWLAKREAVGLPGPQAPLSASRKMVTGSSDQSGLVRS